MGIYSNHLNTILVWYSNGRFVSSCQMFLYLNGGLKTKLKKARYVSYSDESGVWYSDDYCKYQTFEYQKHLNSKLFDVCNI